MDVFGQKWLLSGKSGFNWAKVVVLGQIACTRVNLLFLGKRGRIQAKVVVFGQKVFYSGKVVVFGQNGCIRAKKCFIRAKWL